MEIQVTGLRELIADLDAAHDRAPDEVRGVVQRGCYNVKTDAARRISGLAHAPHYPRSISYDTEVRRDEVRGEVGPDKGRRQGALGNILEFGTVNNPPQPHLGPALEAEAPKFEKALADVADKLLAG